MNRTLGRVHAPSMLGVLTQPPQQGVHGSHGSASMNSHVRHSLTCCAQATAGDVITDSSFTLGTAWWRYESLWLPLLCAWDPARDEAPPAAPLDVALVWLAHLSRPAEYAKVRCASLLKCMRTVRHAHARAAAASPVPVFYAASLKARSAQLRLAVLRLTRHCSLSSAVLVAARHH